MKEFIVRKEVTINEPPSTVWEALTDLSKTKKYFFNCEIFSTWKAGSPITFKGKIFLIKKIEMSGQILNVKPCRLLQYTLRNGKSDTSFSTINDKLISDNGKTILKISDDMGSGERAEKRYKRSLKGWDKVLKSLKQFIESENEK